MVEGAQVVPLKNAVDVAVGERIRAARGDRPLREIADESGLSLERLRRLEDGTERAGQTLYVLVCALHVHMRYFFGGDMPPDDYFL